MNPFPPLLTLSREIRISMMSKNYKLISYIQFTIFSQIVEIQLIFLSFFSGFHARCLV